MTVERVYVKDLGELSKAFARLADNADEIMRRAFMGALVNGQFSRELHQRVPESNPAKYASRRVDPSKSGWQSMNKELKGGELGKGYARYRQYGNQNLKRSFFQGNLNSSNPSLKVETGRYPNGVGVVISSSVAYAAYVHEAIKPREGEYWNGTPGTGGWSKQGSGAHYLDLAFRASEEDIMEQFLKNLEAQLRNLGLMQ